jgi:hypothetical protein
MIIVDQAKSLSARDRLCHLITWETDFPQHLSRSDCLTEAYPELLSFELCQLTGVFQARVHPTSKSPLRPLLTVSGERARCCSRDAKRMKFRRDDEYFAAGVGLPDPDEAI